MTEIEEKETTETHPEPEAPTHADGVLMMQFFQTDEGTKIQLFSHDRHNDNKPLQFPHMLCALNFLKDLVFSSYLNEFKENTPVAKDIPVLNEAFTVLLSKMFTTHLSKQSSIIMPDSVQ